MILILHFVEVRSMFWAPVLVTPGIYLFKVNNFNTRTMCEIFSKLTINTLERRKSQLGQVSLL